MFLILLIIVGLILVYRHKVNEKKEFDRRIYIRQVFNKDIYSQQIIESIKRAKRFKQEYPQYPLGTIQLFNDNDPQKSYLSQFFTLRVYMENYDAFVRETITLHLIAPSKEARETFWIMDALRKYGLNETDTPDECVKKLMVSNIDLWEAYRCKVLDERYQDSLPIIGDFALDYKDHFISYPPQKPQEIGTYSWFLLLEEKIKEEIDGVVVKIVDSTTMHINV